MTVKAFMTRYPVATYFAFTFAISWGGLLTVVGPGGFIGTAEPTSAQLPFDGAVRVSSRFGEMLAEENRGSHFRVCESRKVARAWLRERYGSSEAP